MVLYFMQSYAALFGGLILAVYTMSLWPHISKRLINFPSGKVLPVAMFTYILLVLLSAWVVAYNFVPGGVVTRERSDAMLVLIVLLIGLAARKIEGTEPSKPARSKTRQKGGQKRSSLFASFFRRLSTINEEEGEEWEETMKGSSAHQLRARELIFAEEREGGNFHDRAIKGTERAVLTNQPLQLLHTKCGSTCMYTQSRFIIFVLTFLSFGSWCGHHCACPAGLCQALPPQPSNASHGKHTVVVSLTEIPLTSLVHRSTPTW